MAGDRFGPQAWLAVVELRGLCKEEVEEQWDVARWVLSVFAVQTKNAPRVGVRGISGIGPFPVVGLIGFRRLFLLGFLFHTHPEVIV
jgi:hypothetical protein